MPATKTRVCVLGAGGKMGSEVCRAVLADPELELAGAIDPVLEGEPVAPLVPGAGEMTFSSRAQVGRGGGAAANVAVDFTRAEAVMENARWCARNGIHMVIGTTGLADDDVAELAELFGRSGPNCLLAPNFAIGAVILMKLAEMSAPWFDSVEIVELHHDAKADAPSGTALLTAERIAAASAEWSAEGLLADSETRVVFAQPPSEAPVTRQLLGLTATEADLLAHLPRGVALWKVGERSFVVEHVVGSAEAALVDTDGAMVQVPGGFSVTEGPEGGNSRVHTTESPRTNGG